MVPTFLSFPAGLDMRDPTTRGAAGETVDINAVAPRGQEKPDGLLT
jgi:hypothetical protein